MIQETEVPEARVRLHQGVYLTQIEVGLLITGTIRKLILVENFGVILLYRPHLTL